MNRYAERTRATQASEKYSNLDYELDLCYLECQSAVRAAQEFEQAMDFLRYVEDSAHAQYDVLETQTQGSDRVSVGNLARKFGLGNLFLKSFRFSADELPALINIFKLPAEYRCQGIRTTALEAIMVVLYRMTTSSTYLQMSRLFDLRPSHLCRIFNSTVVRMSEVSEGIKRLDHNLLTSPGKQVQYSNAIESVSGVPLNCIGFIDGNHCDTARPVRGQRMLYSGKSRSHCQKHLIVLIPNGIFYVVGPSIGSRHDAAMVTEHNLVERLSRAISPYTVYADGGFGLTSVIITPYRNPTAPANIEFNNKMARVRPTVEWVFAELEQTFTLLRSKYQLRPIASSSGIATQWALGAHLCNLLTTFHRTNRVASYFNLEVPTTEEYLANF